MKRPSKESNIQDNRQRSFYFISSNARWSQLHSSAVNESNFVFFRTKYANYAMFLIQVLYRILEHGKYAHTPLFSNEHSSLMSVASLLSLSFLDTRISNKFKSLFLVF